MKKSGSKILGIAAAIAVVIYWGNSIFNKVGSSGFSKSEKKITSIQCSLVSVREDAKDQTKYYVNNNLVKEDLTIDINHKNKSVWSSDGNFGSITVWNDNIIEGRSNDSLTGNGKTFTFDRTFTLDRKTGKYKIKVKTSGAGNYMLYNNYKCDKASNKF
jgi:hypothetical protein